ncbi:ECF transporter S component (folate family) [Lachnospiraceae bacterium PF1-21]|uniref:folate family ECF transporter S component n=1 Tax=Ohessyouella blattaphilus TaxID=2949333 RepID=UPI003E271A12
MSKRRDYIKKLVTLGILSGMEIILSRLFSIAAWNLKIGLSFLPVTAAAVIYGPLYGGLVGAFGDLVGALLFPIGAYFPGFTLTAFLTGWVFGLFLTKRQTLPRIIGAVLINQLLLSLLLNSFWISILYGSPYFALLQTRIIQCLIMIPVQIVLIASMNKLIKIYKQKGRLS